MQMIPISSIETCKRQRSGSSVPYARRNLLDSSNSIPRPGNGAVWRIIAGPNKKGAFIRSRALILGSCISCRARVTQSPIFGAEAARTECGLHGPTKQPSKQ
jgi:hypothetical protein